MSKNSPAEYSEDPIARLNVENEKTLEEIKSIHDNTDAIAATHLELLEQAVDGEEYPFQTELDEIVINEDAATAPLIKKELGQEAKLKKEILEKEIEGKFQNLVRQTIAKNKITLDSLRDKFTGDVPGVSQLMWRAEKKHEEIIVLFKQNRKNNDDYMSLANLLAEFNEICEQVTQVKTRAFAKDIKKSNAEQ